MHRIVASHLDSFVDQYALAADDRTVQFEKFANFAVLSGKLATSVDLDDVTTGNDDDGTDGVALIINEEHIVSAGDAESLFAHERRNNDVEVVFVQGKTSDGFDLGDFLKFKESVLRFFTQEPYLALSDLQQEARAAFDVAIKNVPKIRHGKPSVSAFFVTTGNYSAPDALEAGRKDMISQLGELGLFQNVDVRFMGRDDLVSAWVASYSGIEASLTMNSSASLPEIAGIDESYLVVAKAKDYVENLLVSDDGSIRGQLFEENVRHFLGPENPVNEQIAETILNQSSKTRFPVLNNGVTLVSPDVRVQGTTLHISNFQIVNGCQTSHVLYENREALTDDLMVTLKVVETTDEDVFSELVRATNSQSKIEESQFLSLSPIAKRVEAYFNTYEGQDGRLYFERRDRQYVGKGVAAIRVVSLHNAAKCVCAMFVRRPDLSFKYPKRMYEDFGAKIFNEGNREIIYYASALALYRFHLLTSNNTIPQNMRRFKWHILPLAAALVAGKDVPPLGSKKMDAYAQKIIDKFSHHSAEGTAIFTKAVGIIESLGEITNDRLKRQAVLDEMLAHVS
ncbi:AIPR family protein [Marinobacter nanhaiticus D15-8W]|uniref:AIPR family protein n=1 Tax=Marinobacter nanhaiticus D15-8W TaxID=626887 RepID=N6WUA0_9GAMM|nr:AIPR family protein [Marinobacter nanhaiticus]ENO14607.1 AIPR family protein [Marinobacter nanhaiticus D15-8W]BES69707.1 AIPR family protein [Marinobacter nanhaiticus D15-8W]BES69752.1 AIPR family protein [Marinobacter nanhaiticus D15-8W]